MYASRMLDLWQQNNRKFIIVTAFGITFIVSSVAHVLTVLGFLRGSPSASFFLDIDLRPTQRPPNI